MKKDALDMLKEDHKKVRALLSELVESTPRATKKRSRLLEQISQEIRVHTRIEEEIFYPAFIRSGNTRKENVQIFEAKEEHRAVTDLVLPDLESTRVDSDEFSGRAKVLKELIEHHAYEEEKEMFPKAKKLFSRKELQELGSKMQELKFSLQAENAQELEAAVA